MGVSLTLEIGDRTTEGIGSLGRFEDVHEEICEDLQRFAAVADCGLMPKSYSLVDLLSRSPFKTGLGGSRNGHQKPIALSDICDPRTSKAAHREIALKIALSLLA